MSNTLELVVTFVFLASFGVVRSLCTITLFDQGWLRHGSIAFSDQQTCQLAVCALLQRPLYLFLSFTVGSRTRYQTLLNHKRSTLQRNIHIRRWPQDPLYISRVWRRVSRAWLGWLGGLCFSLRRQKQLGLSL